MQLDTILRQARKASGQSQTEVAVKTGLTQRTLSQLENGRGSVAALLKVAAAVDLRLNGLARGRSLVDQVRASRAKRHWTVAELAGRVGLDAATVRNLEAGRGRVESLTKVLTVLLPRLEARATERVKWSGGARDERFTPAWLLQSLVDAFGPVSCDPCGHPDSLVEASQVIMPEEDGLQTKWRGSFAFVNPPFSNFSAWIARCHEAWRKGEASRVVCLAPARTNSRAWAAHVGGVAHIHFIQGAVNFVNSDPAGRGGYTYPLALICWGATDEELLRLAEGVPGSLLRAR